MNENNIEAGSMRTPRRHRTESHSPRGDKADAAASIARQIEQRGASVVQLAYTDLLGETGGALLSVSELDQVLAGQLPVSVDAGDASARNLSPDLRTLRFLPAQAAGAQVARLVCDLRQSDGGNLDDCPRRSLKQVVASARRSGLTFRVGVECSVTGRTGHPSLLEAMITTLSESRLPGLIGRWQGFDRSASIGFGPLPPVDAADGLQLLRDVFVRTAPDPAIMTGRPGPDFALARIALSAYRGRNKLFDAGVGEGGATAAFLSGLRAHAGGLTALLRPAIAAEDFAGWTGHQRNSTGGLRLVWEHGWAGSLSVAATGGDGALVASGLGISANPYLLMAGLVSAGLDGTLPTELPAGDLVATCPSDPETALCELDGDQCLRQGLGGAAVDAYGKAVRAHWARTARK